MDCNMPANVFLESTQDVRAFFDELKREFPEVVWVDPSKLMCDAEKCVTQIDGVPLYKDDEHLNIVGSRLLAEEWLARFGNPLVDD